MRSANTAIICASTFSCCLIALQAGAVDHATAARQRHAAPDAALIAQWNRLGYEIAFAEDQFTTFKGQRALAMMHLAQHDALNSIDPRFEGYAMQRRTSRAEPAAAAAHAAREILVSQYPGARSEIDALLAEQLGPIASHPRARELGAGLGRAAAAAMLERRSNDGWAVEGSYEFAAAPGAYQTTPDWQGFVVHPGLAHAKPFMLKTPAQFRPPPPPPLSSRAYARAFNEVKAYGALAGAARTPEQTAYAVWWMEFSEGLVNRHARTAVQERNLDAWSAARLFALMNAALVDSYVAVWNSKYHFNHWRPYTAIREAHKDGNSRTQADPEWNSLRPAPPFPEYVSAHAAGCASTFEILTREFGRGESVTLDSLTAPPGTPTRSFRSFRAAAAECADSRVRIGFHFRYATDAGLELGRRVADHAAEHYLRRRTKVRSE